MTVGRQRVERDEASRRLRNSGLNEALDRLRRPCRRWSGRRSRSPPPPARRADVGGHDQDDVAEVGLAAVVVGQRGVVHHLQQDVEDVRVRLLDLVEQQHRVRRLADRRR